MSINDYTSKVQPPHSQPNNRTPVWFLVLVLEIAACGSLLVSFE